MDQRELLEAWRQRGGWDTPTDMARAVSINVSTFNLLVNGKRVISPHYLNILAKKLTAHFGVKLSTDDIEEGPSSLEKRTEEVRGNMPLTEASQTDPPAAERGEETTMDEAMAVVLGALVARFGVSAVMKEVVRADERTKGEKVPPSGRAAS